MKLKAIVAAGLAALALSGVLASTSAANTVVLDPTPQEMAEHPGMSHSAWCEVSEAESRESQFTDAYMEKANEEGKCHERWEAEAPLAAADQHPSNVVSAKASRHARKQHRHRRTRRHR